MEATRTLLKSAPELWAEVSDADALGRHLGAFGTVRITRMEPGSMVVWEGDRGHGEVRLTPAGLGTRVTLVADDEVEQLEAAVPPSAAPARRRGLLARLLGRGRDVALVPDQADLEPEPDPPGPEDIVEWRFPLGPDAGLAVLNDALDALGSARHRPFSRA